jgi:hypothetical protein
MVGFASSLLLAVVDVSRVAVLPVAHEANAVLPPVVDEYVLTAAQNCGDFVVVGPSDINTLLGFERQRELAGCDALTCFSEIGGALGVDHLVQVSVARLEGTWLATAKLIDVKTSQVRARSASKPLPSTDALIAAFDPLVRELFGVAPLFTAAPGLTGEDFGLAGIEAGLYGDFLASKLSYRAWAREHNAQESTTLEVFKWVTTSITGIFLPFAIGDNTATGWGAISFFAVPAVALWWIDLADSGNVPEDLQPATALGPIGTGLLHPHRSPGQR